MKINYTGRDLEAMSFAKNYHDWILSKFKKFIGHTIAEVGAGSGNFTSLLHNESVQELIAIEPSHEMYPLLTNKFAQDKKVICRQTIFADVYTEYIGYFDTILYVNVLEHIEDDRKELGYVYKALKTDGYVCLFVPALSWLYTEYDASVGHHRRYDKYELAMLIESTGFDIVTISYFDILGIVPWFIFFKLFKKKLTANNAILYDRIAVPSLRWIESLLSVPIGKNLFVIARKGGQKS